MEDLQNKLWLILIVAIISTAVVISIALIVIGGPLAQRYAETTFKIKNADEFLLHFDESFDSVNNKEGHSRGVSFVSGHSGEAALFDDEDSLSYSAAVVKAAANDTWCRLAILRIKL